MCFIIICVFILFKQIYLYILVYLYYFKCNCLVVYIFYTVFMFILYI